jgi:hypothetical protein
MPGWILIILSILKPVFQCGSINPIFDTLRDQVTLRYVTLRYDKFEILRRSDVLTRSLEHLEKQESYVLLLSVDAVEMSSRSENYF